MKYSVVIPLCNKEKHIDRAIESVLAQSHDNLEIIVVDDGSTDTSAERVESFTDIRVKLVKQKNQGVSSARNKGIEIANFEYIGFLDADDVWKPFFLEEITKLIHKFPSAGAYATAHERKKINGDLVRSPEGLYSYENDGEIINYFKHSIKTPVISASSVVIPKKIFENLEGFPEGISRGEDQDMWVRIALNYEIAFSKRISATYFQDTDNMATRKMIKYNKSYLSYAEDILIKEKEKGNKSIYFEEYMIKIIIRKARYFIDIKQRKKAREILLKYRYTRLNKKPLFKGYILSFSSIYYLNQLYQKIKRSNLNHNFSD